MILVIDRDHSVVFSWAGEAITASLMHLVSLAGMAGRLGSAGPLNQQAGLSITIVLM